MHSLQDLWVSTHPKVVIGAPDSDALILGILVRLRKLLGQAVDVVEVSVGFVLVLLVQFSVVETLVIEFRRTRIGLSWLTSGLCMGKCCLLSALISLNF